VGAVLYRLRTVLRWPATIGIASVAAVAGVLVLTLLAGALRTLSAPDRYDEAQGNLFTATVEQQTGAPRNRELGALDSTTRVETATFVFGGVVSPGGDEPEETIVFAGSEIAVGVAVVEGRTPRTSSPGEFVATRSFAEAAGAELGARFTLLTFTRAQGRAGGFDAGAPEGPTVDATLVGVIDGPAVLQDDVAVAVFPGSLLAGRDIGTSATIAAVRLAPGATVTDLRAELATLPDGQQFSADPATSLISKEVRAAVSAQGQGLAILAAIAAVSTIVVLGQLLSRQYRLRDSERSALSAIGLTHGQLVLDPVVRAAVAVVGGLLVAGSASYLLSGSFPRGFVTRLEPDPGRLLHPTVHLAGPVLLALAVLAWMFVSLAAGRSAPEPVRSTSLVARLVPALPGAASGIALHFALGRHPGRTRAARVPLIGLVAIAALVFGALTFGRNLLLISDEPARYGVNFDVGLGQGGEVTAEELQPLLDDPQLSRDIEGMTLYSTLPLDANGQPLFITGMRPLVGRLLPEVLSGRLPQSPDEVAIGRVTARRLDVDAGDPLTLATASGRRTLVVTGTVQPPSVAGADLIGDGAVVTDAAFRTIAPDQPAHTAVIDLVPGSFDRATRRITALTGMAAGQVSPPTAVTNLDRVRSIPFLVAAVVGGLAVVSLGHQLLVAVRRRRVDLAVLRTFGASRRGVTRVIHLQATIIALVVLALAVPLGIAAGTSIYRPFVERIGARQDLVVPGGWVVAALTAWIVLANLVAAVPARRARRTAPAQVLASG
jgi:hypothetical protein